MELFELGGYTYNTYDGVRRIHIPKWEYEKNGWNKKQYYHHHLQYLKEFHDVDIKRKDLKLYHKQHLSMGGELFEVNKDGSLGGVYNV